MGLAIDTLQLARSLTDAGMDRAQAEALSSGLARSLKDSDVATKADINLLKLELESQLKDMSGTIDGQGRSLRAEIAAQGKELRAEMEGLRKDVKIDLAGMRAEIANSRNQTILAMVGIVGLALAAARFLF